MRSIFHKSRSIAGCIMLLGVFAILLLWSCGEASKNSASPDSPYLNHNDTVSYVGIQTCRGCHNEIYQTFIQTGMGSSFDVASPQKSVADYKKHHLVYDRFKDLYYHPYWSNGAMYIMEFRLQGKDTVHKRVEKVDYIVGSGQHTNSHMMAVNGYLYQLPLTWYAQKQKWDLPPGFEDGRNVRFSRAIGFECMSCHNAMPTFVANSTNKFLNIPQGIDCERCHGPGGLHVKEKLAGIRVDTATQIDYTIVNPRKLSWDLQIDVCQRCHLQGNAVLKNGKSFSDFKPGKKLSDFIDIYMPKYIGHEDEFIMASHAQRLQKSKCFIQSASGQTNNLTCITCHNPHVSVKVTGKQVFNQACLNCHNNQKACTENIVIRKASNDNCWGCHMPKSGTIDIPHVTVTDHWIRVPVKKKQKEALKKFAGIYCINHPGSDNKTKAQAYLSYYEKFEGEAVSLDSAYVLMGETDDASLSDLELKIRWLYLKKDDAAIVRLASVQQAQAINDPWSAYRIGQAYQNLQRPQEAYLWYEKATSLAPDNLDFANKFASIPIALSKFDEAIMLLESVIKLNPKQPETYTNLGFAYLNTKEYDKAMSCYDKALALDPDYQQALFNKAALCNMQHQNEEAKRLLKHILKNDPNNAYVKQLLNSI